MSILVSRFHILDDLLLVIYPLSGSIEKSWLAIYFVVILVQVEESMAQPGTLNVGSTDHGLPIPEHHGCLFF